MTLSRNILKEFKKQSFLMTKNEDFKKESFLRILKKKAS